MTETERTTPAPESAMALARGRLLDEERARVDAAAWVAITELIPHPDWCTSAVDDEAACPPCAPREVEDGRRLHRGPRFGDVTVFGMEDLGTLHVTWDVDLNVDVLHNSTEPDVNIDGLAQLIIDGQAALKWIESHR